MKKNIAIICGPTASGKSNFAIDYAIANNGIIVNCDSQQVYKDLRILTARPTMEDEQIVPHRLYGFLSGENNIANFSVVDWVKYASMEIDKIINDGQLPVFVGGTGFYIFALINGITEIPEINFDVRKKVRLMSNDEIYLQLKQCDIKITDTLSVGDTQRIMRALEVYLSTGMALSDWQKMPLKKFITDCDFNIIYKNPDRELLLQNIEKRTLKMLQGGAIDEVKSFLNIGYSKSLSVSKSIGVQEISDYIDGKISFDEMQKLIIIRTRQYAKRQNTWFRNQFSEDQKSI